MPIDKANYPPDWKNMAEKCKAAAGWKCEWCGMGHMADGTMGSCLTVHHPDKDPWNPDARLVALCARCHLRADQKLRKAEQEKNQLKLF